MSLENNSEIFLSSTNGGQKMIALAKDWLAYIKHRQSPATFRSYKSAILLFIDTLPTKIDPHEIHPCHIENFLSTVVRTHKISTANNYLRILKSFYKWAEEFSDVPNSTAPVTELREPPPNRRILSEAEYQSILRISKSHAHDTVQFLANTGLRRNEFRYLTWANFNGDFVCVTGKGSKVRYVPLNQICKQVLGKDRSGISPPFVNKYKSQNSLYKLCAQLSQKANIEYFTPHSFRHFFATRLIRKGVPLMVVSKILGHSSVEITEKIYVHLQNDDLKVTDCLEF